MAVSPTRSKSTLKTDLQNTLSTLNPPGEPKTLAPNILNFDRKTNVSLVGIDYTGTRVILYNTRTLTALAVRCSATDLADGGTPIATFAGRAEFRDWIEKMRLYWGWLHPRYRHPIDD